MMKNNAKSFDLNEYRKSKIMVDDLTALLRGMKATALYFSKYEKYVAVKELMQVIRSNRPILYDQLKHYKSILNKKGEIDNG